MTFDEWWEKNPTLQILAPYLGREMCELAWNAGIEEGIEENDTNWADFLDEHGWEPAK